MLFNWWATWPLAQALGKRTLFFHFIYGFLQTSYLQLTFRQKRPFFGQIPRLRVTVPVVTRGCLHCQGFPGLLIEGYLNFRCAVFAYAWKILSHDSRKLSSRKSLSLLVPGSNDCQVCAVNVSSWSDFAQSEEESIGPRWALWETGLDSPYLIHWGQISERLFYKNSHQFEGVGKERER